VVRTSFDTKPAAVPVPALVKPVTLALKPQVLSIPHVKFTEAMRQAGMSGKVIVKVRLGADGVATPLAIVRSMGADADSAALEVARRISYVPARDSSGQPVDWTVELVVDLDIS
jgi:TonB family protein